MITDFENKGKNTLTSPIPEEDPVIMTTFPLTLSDSLLFLMKPKSVKNIENGINTTRSETVTIGRKMLRILFINEAISLFDSSRIREGSYSFIHFLSILLFRCRCLGINIKD